MALTSASQPSLWRFARVEFDPVRNRPVLLYPEGAVLLNETGADEVIATAQIFDHAARLRSFEIAASVFREINEAAAKCGK